MDEKNKLIVTPVKTRVTGEIPILLLAIQNINSIVITLPNTEKIVVVVKPRNERANPDLILITAPSAPPEDTPNV